MSKTAVVFSCAHVTPEAPERSGLLKALRSYQQADEEGIMVLVLRQACDEAADTIEALQARVAEMEEGINAICQYGRDTLSGPINSSDDTRDWQRAAVLEMTTRATLILIGYPWDSEEARAALQEDKE